MYNLIVKHKEQVIIHKQLTDEEASGVAGFGAQWILNAFVEHIGLDIGNYTLSEYDNFEGGFILYIRSEDLERLRNNKFDKLGL